MGEKLFPHFSHIPCIRGRNRCFSGVISKEDTRVNKAVCPRLTLIRVLSAWLQVKKKKNLRTLHLWLPRQLMQKEHQGPQPAKKFFQHAKRNLGSC